MTTRSASVSLLAGMLALALVLPASAQTSPAGRAIPQPEYGSDISSGFLSDSHFNTPESDGRPGVQFYARGMYAFHQGDYRHAVQQLEISAYWAFKPAQYNLGVMYFQGEGVPVNRPLGAAWMFLAAERNTPLYVAARHTIVTSLDSEERAQAYALLQKLEKKYGDKVALRRAKAQWAFAKADETGTRVGGTAGELHVGVPAAHGSFGRPTGSMSGGASLTKSSWMEVLKGGSVDGSLAYQQFRQSDNPYDRVYLQGQVGTTSIGPLQPVAPEKKQATKQPTQELLWCNKRTGCT